MLFKKEWNWSVPVSRETVPLAMTDSHARCPVYACHYTRPSTLSGVDNLYRNLFRPRGTPSALFNIAFATIRQLPLRPSHLDSRYRSYMLWPSKSLWRKSWTSWKNSWILVVTFSEARRGWIALLQELVHVQDHLKMRKLMSLSGIARCRHVCDCGNTCMAVFIGVI
jgi:hypothetical protein